MLCSPQAERRAASFTQLDQRILSIFYWWSVISVFIGAMLGGSIFSQFRVALEDPGAPAKPCETTAGLDGCMV